MTVLEQCITVPQSNQHYKHTSCNNVCSQRRNFSVTCPASRVIDVGNFHYFQVVHTSNHGISQGHSNKNKEFVIYSMPKNCSFPLERVHWRETCLASHKYCPSEGCSCRTSIQTFLIPKKLWSCSIRKATGRNLSNRLALFTSFIFLSFGVKVFCAWRRVHRCRPLRGCRSKKREGTVNRPEQHTPNTCINNYIDNHISPKNTNRICRSVHKGAVISITLAYCSSRTLRYQQLTVMTNATISKQTFNVCLSLRCNSSNNHRECSKQSLSTTKRQTPNNMPMMCPESKHCNFRQYCDPQRYTRPSSHIYIRYPKMLWSCCQFPQQSSRNKPNTQSSKQRRIISCSLYDLFNVWQRSFSSLPVDEAYSQKLLTTSKSTQQKVFHCCFKRISTFGILTTKNNQRETLLLHAKVQRHLISCHNLLVLTHQSLHCQIDIFSMSNSSNFLPSIRYSQNNASSQKQKSTLAQTVCIFLKRSSQKNKGHWTCNSQLKRKKTPNNCPQCQSRNCVVRSSSLKHTELSISFVFFVSQSVLDIALRLISNCQNFSNRSYKISSTKSKLHKKTKKLEKLRSKKNQIQDHLQNFIQQQQKRESNP